MNIQKAPQLSYKSSVGRGIAAKPRPKVCALCDRKKQENYPTREKSMRAELSRFYEPTIIIAVKIPWNCIGKV